MSTLRRTLLFATIFIALQTLWLGAEGTSLERLVIDQATVAVAATWINILTPDMPAVAVGSRLAATGGGINILRGCEGADAMFLLIAAFAVSGLKWRARLAGATLGMSLVYLLNQARIVALFYAFRNDRFLFDQLHGTIGPLLLVALVGLFYFAWLHWATSARDACKAA